MLEFIAALRGLRTEGSPQVMKTYRLSRLFTLHAVAISCLVPVTISAQTEFPMVHHVAGLSPVLP